MPYSWRALISGAKKFFINVLVLKKIFFKLWPGKNSTPNNLIDQSDLDQELFVSLAEHKKKWPSLGQLKYLQEVLRPEEKRKIRFYFFIATLALLVLLIFGYFNWTTLAPKAGGAYSEGAVGYPKYLNPLYASFNTVDTDLSKLIYAGLVRLDNKNNLVPDLAEKWEISADQKVYTFTLRSQAKWHNGELVTLEDVIFTFELIKDPAYQSPWQSIFSAVKIEPSGDNIIRFILSEPQVSFLENLTVGIMPKNIWQDVSAANMLLADYNLKPIGAGPFAFKSLTKDKSGNLRSYTLVRFKDFYQKPAYLEEITFKFYNDYDSALEALKNHNIDGLNYLPKDGLEKIFARKDLNYHNLQLPQYSALFFNSANNPALADLKVRQALAHALNKEQLVSDILKGAGSAIEGPILAGFIGYHPNIKPYNYNLDQAGELLTAAGWLVVEGKTFRQKKDQELKIVITTVNRGENPFVVEAIQKMWQNIGIKTELKLIDSGTIKNDIIKPRSFEVLLFSEILGYDSDPYPFWHSSQAGPAGLNLSNFINKDADKLLIEARGTADPQVRHDKYVAFQDILSRELPAIFLYAPKYIYPLAKHIQGLDTANITNPADRFANITNWYINTRRVLK
ncbi:MAG TPA: ABC transporter substrate-binding protein [bacterium]|nr:ABC transporter substrate-binding protein [bacterium]HPL95413.1 ABC transporter substrate-binding protein [bacterium]